MKARIVDLNNLRDEDLLNAKMLAQISPFGRDRTYALLNSRFFPSMTIGKRKYVTYGNWKKWLMEYQNREIAI